MEGSQESLKLLNSTEADAENPDKDATKRSRLEAFKGILVAFFIPISHVTGGTSVELLERRIPDLQLQAFRSFAIVLFTLMWISYSVQLPIVPFSDVVATVLYAFLTTLGATAIYISFALIPVTAAQCTNSTLNLLSGLLIFGLCGKERIGPAKVLFVFLCVAGVVLVLQPWHHQVVNRPDSTDHVHTKSNCSIVVETLCEFKMSRENGDKLENCKHLIDHNLTALNCKYQASTAVNQIHVNTTELCMNLSTCWSTETVNNHYTLQKTHKRISEIVHIFLWQIPAGFITMTGVIIAGFAGLMFTLLTFVVKQNPCLSEHRCRSLFWAFTTCLVCSLVLTFVLEAPKWPQNLFDSGAVAAHCIASVSTWFSYLYAVQYVSGTLVNIMFCSSIILFLIPQYTILDSVMPGHRNWMEVVGVFLVLLGSVSGSLYEMFCTSK